MDKMILGLLMMKRLNMYEIRGIIRRNFKSISSDSLGSIQTALKKLLAAGLITFVEYTEKSVNKKQYSITDLGRADFSEWVRQLADLTDTKNMELGRLLFMGFVPTEKRVALIEGIINQLEAEAALLQTVWDSVEGKPSAKQEVAILQYGIDSFKFNIEWFQ